MSDKPDVDALIAQLAHRIDVGTPDADLVASLVAMRAQQEEIADLEERARMVDASISCAAMGHYKRGDSMHDDYKSVGLNDVLDLRDKWMRAEAEVDARNALLLRWLQYTNLAERGDMTVADWDQLRQETHAFTNAARAKEPKC